MFLNYFSIQTFTWSVYAWYLLSYTLKKNHVFQRTMNLFNDKSKNNYLEMQTQSVVQGN